MTNAESTKKARVAARIARRERAKAGGPLRRLERQAESERQLRSLEGKLGQSLAEALNTLAKSRKKLTGTEVKRLLSRFAN